VIPLYMDEHVPRAITIGLRLRGVDVLTVQEDNNSGKSDPELLERAVYLKRAIFTNDDDLLVEAANRQREGHDFCGVIYAHHLRVSICTCINDLELLAKSGKIEEIINRVIFVPLK
jgi:predicted nuclease of predicted toxin-antitoxin system